MKNLKKLFIIFIATLTAIACGEPEVPVELFDVMTKGAFARKMTQSGGYNYYDVSGSSIDIHVEYYDEAKGANIASYDIDVEYVDLISGGSKSVGRVDFVTIQSSEFVVNSSGYLSSDISLGFGAALAAIGKSRADIDGGSYFRYHMTITKKDGTVYTNDNTGPNMKSSNAFRALFYLDASIVCPSDIAATWDSFNTTQGTWTVQSWCPVGLTSTYSGSWVADGDVYYVEPTGQFDWGTYLACGYGTNPGGNLKIKDACSILSPTGASRWGETYVFNSVVSSNGNNTVTLDWINSYDEGGISELTRSDGGTWPEFR
ncbi:MAG TPA: hypothetical protein EYQ68_05285 [Cytophagales bacterium]|jgi:hypothetical protein|nr:hypothetical protein [Cytophagales bacterium]